MSTILPQFQSWVQKKSGKEAYFSGTFWFVFSTISESAIKTALGFQPQGELEIPSIGPSATMSVRKKTGKLLQASFWYLPLGKQNIHVFFSLKKPSDAVKPMYTMLARSKGKAHLFPLGHPLIKLCAQISPARSLEETYVMRGVSYPSSPSEGGADINLKPGNASAFFTRLEEERRVLKTARLRAPSADGDFCEFTVSRIGYLSFHRGNLSALLTDVTDKLMPAMVESVKPFERAKGQFVTFRFSEPYFANRASYKDVLDALSRLPRTSVALLHGNPYFHAAITNYEDGGEFDVFITGHSDIVVQGRGQASPASFLRLQDGLTSLFRDATVKLEESPAQYRLRDLVEGRI